MNRRSLEALIKSGALDQMGESRWILMAALDDALRAADQIANNSAAGINDLFGHAIAVGENGEDPFKKYRDTRSWTLLELLSAEKESLGSFLSGHPMDAHEAEVKKFAPRPIRELQVSHHSLIAGFIFNLRTVKTQRGPMAVIPRRPHRGLPRRPTSSAGRASRTGSPGVQRHP